MREALELVAVVVVVVVAVGFVALVAAATVYRRREGHWPGDEER